MEKESSKENEMKKHRILSMKWILVRLKENMIRIFSLIRLRVFYTMGVLKGLSNFSSKKRGFL